MLDTGIDPQHHKSKQKENQEGRPVISKERGEELGPDEKECPPPIISAHHLQPKADPELSLTDS